MRALERAIREIAKQVAPIRGCVHCYQWPAHQVCRVDPETGDEACDRPLVCPHCGERRPYTRTIRLIVPKETER